MAKWTIYHAADLELYLAVIPFAVAPVVLWHLLARGRAGGSREAAFAVSFITINLGFLLVAGAFSSLPYGYDRLTTAISSTSSRSGSWSSSPGSQRDFHDLRRADDRSRARAGAARGPPLRQLANEAGVDTVPGALWVWLEAQTAGPNPVSARVLLAVFVVGLWRRLCFSRVV